MSPSAVTERLRLMDELWELSVKLMNSKIVPSGESDVDVTVMNDPEVRTSRDEERQQPATREVWIKLKREE